MAIKEPRNLEQLKEKMILLVIDEAGLPMFQYPPDVKGFEKMDDEDDEILFSGLLSAIDSIGRKVIGDDIQQIKFGSIFLSFSRDKWGHLYVYILRNLPTDETLVERLHLETMGLFNQEIRPLLEQINKPLIPPEEKSLKEKTIHSIFDPFFKLWLKRLQ